jgi:HD-like signal output (HDOD) protein
MSMTLQADPKAKVSEIIRKVTTIATLPEVTVRIIKTVEDPKSSAQQLHKIVSHDPALVTRILKVVNSAFYGLPGQIGSIDRAIVLLGLNGIKNIAVAASLGQLFRGATLCEGYSAKDLWTHCVAVGVAARDLAKNMRIDLPDEAFLAGMIHDVGILLSLQVFPEKLHDVCEIVKKTGGEFCAVEQQIIGLDHQQLGMGLAEQWKFPRACQLVAGYHHNPEQLADQSRFLVNLVYAADTLVATAKYGFPLTACNQKLDATRMADLQLDAVAVETTRAKLPDLVSEACVLLA